MENEGSRNWLHLRVYIFGFGFLLIFDYHIDTNGLDSRGNNQH